MENREFRSRLNTLPIEFKCEIGELPYQKGMRAVSKRKKALELLDKYKIPYVELGTGTNRFIVKYDGYAMKIALDNEGVADNRQEWVMSNPLGEGRAEAYEISRGGNLLMAQYAGAFTSFNDFYAYRQLIYPILSRWNSMGILLGDVGVTKINYANWGLLPNGKPVCIDYAYLFPANMDLFECTCGSKNMKVNEEYTAYACLSCGKFYEDRDLRVRISPQTRMKLFSDVIGIEMSQPVETHPVDDKYIVKISESNPDVISDEQVALDIAHFDLTGESVGGNWYKI